MGYNISYSLQVRTVKSRADYEKLVEGLSQHHLIFYVFDRGWWNHETGTVSFYPFDSVKWYTHEIDMLAVSREFPEYTFSLFCNGDEALDMRYKYYLNGRSEECKATVTFPEPRKIVWPEAVECIKED